MNPLTSKIALVQPEKICHSLWILAGKSKITVITIMINGYGCDESRSQAEPTPNPDK